MTSLRMDNAWFHRQRHLLFAPWAKWDTPGARPPWAESSARDVRTVRATQQGCAAGSPAEATKRMLKRLPLRHELATRAHMQLFRACLEATSLVPSDQLMHSAVQLEWLWYTTPFKGFYRDHLAHVMKVATIALTLWREQGLLCDGRLIDAIAGRLASRQAGSNALRRAARRLGNDEQALREPAFWRQAVLEATRLACLLHDLAYPSIMAGTYVTPAAAITDPIGPPGDERAHLAQRALGLAEDHLLMAPFLDSDADQPAKHSQRGDAAFVKMVLTSHSLQAGLRILQFGAEADRVWRLTPLEAFVIEWAAAAAALHDYDKAFELHLQAPPHAGAQAQPPHNERADPLARWFDASPDGERHTMRIRPSLDRDPVSYMVALADQLQDFGRLNLEAEQASMHTSLRLSVPVQEVSLTRQGKTLQLTWTLAAGAPADAANKVRTGKLGTATSDVIKRRGARGVVFWPPDGEASCWLDHGGWFDGISLDVRDP
ncbi:MAG: hypothetical protein IPI49_04585 [Myxococcales bacterium]|nr:hypothetical protein [Myxococcales bacterium]